MDGGQIPMKNISASNRTMNYTQQEIEEYLESLSIEKTYHIFLSAMIFVGVLAVTGLCGNSLVIVVYSKYFKRNPSRVFILSLAIFDLLSNILCSPGEIIDLRHSFNFPSSTLCQFFRYNNFFATTSSVLTLVAISIERYKKICQPHSKQITEKAAFKIMVVICAVSLITSIPAIILSGLRAKETDRPGIYGHDCTFNDKYKYSVYPKIYLGVQFLMFIICAVILVVLYCLIGVAIYRLKHRRNTLGNDVTKPATFKLREGTPENSAESTTDTDGNKDEERKDDPKSEGFTSVISKCKQKRNSEDKTGRVHSRRRPSLPTIEKYKTTFMLLTITIAFIISYLPYLIISVVKVSVKNFESRLSTDGYIAYTVFLRSFFINATVNSIIYSFWNKMFRDGVKDLFQFSKTYSTKRQQSSQIHSL